MCMQNYNQSSAVLVAQHVLTDEQIHLYVSYLKNDVVFLIK